MRLKQALRRDLETMKHLDRRAKRQMIWDYYKLPIIVFCSVLVLTGITLTIRLSAANTALYAVFINADDSGDRTGLETLLARGGIRMDDRKIDVSAGYMLRYDDPANTYADTVQVLAALFGIGDLDVFAADEPVFRAYADKEAFVDLSLFIEREELDKHSLYSYTGEGGREIVAGIIFRPPSPLHDAGYYSGEVIVGVAANARNLDEALALVKEMLITPDD